MMEPEQMKKRAVVLAVFGTTDARASASYDGLEH